MPYIKGYYYHMREEDKKKKGRPRKYDTGRTEHKKRVYTPKELNRQQTAELLRGVKIIDVDYATLEEIAIYPSINAYALDYDIPASTISNALKKSQNGEVVYIKKHKKALRKVV